MAPLRTLLAALAAAALFLPQALPQALGAVGEAPADRAALEPRAIPLGTLRADPLAALDRRVGFVLQLDRALPTWNAFHTRFGPADFAGYRAWADERFLWEREAFDDPAPRLFAHRGSVAERVLSTGRPYERFRVTAVVRDVFLGEPWIEIQTVERLPEHVSEGAILHAARGLQLAREGDRKLARGQLERARGGLLPAHARDEIDRLLAAL